MKNLIKKLLPKQILLSYHYVLGFLGAVFYGFPSKKMIIIGITGTKGKTTTANFVWAVLNGSGIKTGLLTTANLRIGNEEILNPFHMTMPGRFVVQKYLSKMQKAGCKVAIVETTSQGLVQYRHIGISYDMAIFTNLTPEHIDSHGSFENYKKAKKILFDTLAKSKNKIFEGKEIKKVIIANADSEHADFFLESKADKKFTFSLATPSDAKAENVVQDEDGVRFSVDGDEYKIHILGTFNTLNALPGILIGKEMGLSVSQIQGGLLSVSQIPGRMEEIKGGQNFRVFVDYAHEKFSMTYVCETARLLAGSEKKVIVLLGAEGGGRDKGKRPVMGEIVGRLADYVIASNVDPYEDDPLPIATDIADAAEKAGKKKDENLFVILDRREGIKKSFELAKEGDIVFITGKGAEQSMVIGGQSIPWDDRVIVKEELAKIVR